MKRQKKRFPRIILTIVVSLVGLCLVMVIAVAMMNTLSSDQANNLDRLSKLDKIRLAEAFHLRQSLGDEMLPGFSQAEIPVVLYNENYAFLVGLSDPADGWRVVPSGKQLGSAWEIIPGDDFFGQPYYRQKLPASGETPQGFTVQVGYRWAASLGTLDYLWAWGVDDLQKQLPEWLQPIVPVRFFVRNLLLAGSDMYTTDLLHESVHAYQGIRAEQTLKAAETVYATDKSAYSYADEDFQANWQAELKLLNDALKTADEDKARQLAREFLQQRNHRRESARLANSLIQMEQLKEWEEGIAKYSELMAYRLAGNQNGYQPFTETTQDPEFNSYRGGQKKWDNEIQQILREAGVEGDGRFYYTGFAQAVLLDRFAPGWQVRLFDDGVTLEGLLAEAMDD